MFRQIFLTLVSFLLIQSAISQTAEQFYNEGQKLEKKFKYAEALVSYKKAIAKDPKYKEAQFGAGWINNELKKYADAIPFLQKAKDLWPNEAKIYLELGYANEKLGKKNEAIKNYDKCLSLDPEYALAYKYLGRMYYDDGDYTKSLENLKKYFQNEPESKDDDLYYRKGVSENELELYNDAVISLTKADELNPKNVKFLNELGYTYYKLGGEKEALNYYKDAAALDPKSLTALNGIADVYRKLKKDQNEAIRLYAKTLEINPKNINANYWTGWCYNEMGKYNDAIPYLKKVIEADDQYVSAYTELGYCDYALKNYDDALVSFKKAFTIERTELTMYYTSLCYIGKKDKQAALTMLDDLKAINSKYVKEVQEKIDNL
ncbi:MAG TPA: tetratricopeptide repeat protein [Ferruginibacter sp.]|jgi:tetratricopeptide (TPR) repeat protein|nr:tetratricopeptide repeat protein [Ferruginibacter sp.]